MSLPRALLLASLPWLAAPALGEQATQPYVVQRGDTLIGIRDRLLVPGADWRAVQRLNRVADPRRLPPGRTLQLPQDLLLEQPAVAEALHVFGNVSASRAGAAPGRLAAGSTLSAGDVVRTGAQASATLRFVDGSRVLIRPDSELKLERLTQSADGRRSSTQLQLQRGAADASVVPGPQPGARRFELRNPVAHLGVRGTAFRTQVEPGELRFEVLEGRVAAAAGRGETAVPAGFGAVAGRAPIAVRALLPAPELAGLPARVDRLPLVLKWPAQVGAQGYRAQVLRDGEVLVADAKSAAPGATFGEDLADGRYTLHLRAIDAGGLEGRDAQAAFVLKARPEPPFLQKPAAAATVYDERVEFTWTRSREAARYRLQVADSADFAAPRLDRDDLAANGFAIALPPGAYHWRVASVRADGDQGPFGDVQPLVRRDPPPAPPPAESSVTDAGLALRWRASEEPGAKYAWQLAGAAGFGTPLREGTVATPALLLADLAAGTYSLRVRTINADGAAGPWGAAQEIDVPRSPWWWLLALPALLLL
jgi:hypothetical protein